MIVSAIVSPKSFQTSVRNLLGISDKSFYSFHKIRLFSMLRGYLVLVNLSAGHHWSFSFTEPEYKTFYKLPDPGIELATTKRLLMIADTWRRLEGTITWLCWLVYSMLTLAGFFNAQVFFPSNFMVSAISNFIYIYDSCFYQHTRELHLSL